MSDELIKVEAEKAVVKPKKEKRVNPLDSLQGIKLKTPMKKDDDDNIIPQVIEIPVRNTGFTSIGYSVKKYKMADLEASPILMIKSESKLAGFTTATPEQVELIMKTPIAKLKNL